MFVLTSAAVFRRDVLADAGLFDERLRIAEDYDLFLRVFALGPVAAIEEPLVRYRRHALFGFFVAGGVAAPDGNPLTMALLAIPMYALYELSIWIIVPLERRWRTG